MYKILLFSTQPNKSRFLGSLASKSTSSYSTSQNEKHSGYKLVSGSRRSSNWPNKSLGPIDNLNPKYPLPGNIGFVADVTTTTIEKSVNSSKDYIAAVNSLPLHREDHYLTVLTQTFANIEFSDNTHIARPLIAEIPEVFKVPEEENTSTHGTKYTLHRCPHLLRYALSKYYPQLPKPLDLTTVTHLYKTRHANDVFSEEMAQERTNLADQFISKAIELCSTLREMNYWADFINPYTGKPYLAPHFEGKNEVITETHPAMEQLGFEVDQLGCCRVVRHRVWGSNIFIGLVFTDAPRSHPVLAEFDHQTDL